MAAVGKRVWVPFGKRMITGYIWRFRENIGEEEAARLKPVADILDEVPLFPDSMIPFFEWISDYYMYPLGEVVKTALPGGINPLGVDLITITEQGLRLLESNERLSEMAHEILTQIASGPLTLKKISAKINRPASHALIYSLEKKGLLTREKSVIRGRVTEKTEKFIRLAHPDMAMEGLSEKKRTILQTLGKSKEMATPELKQAFPWFTTALVRGLEKSGHVAIEERTVYRDPFGETISRDQAPALSEEQTQAVSQIEASLGKGYANVLLFGVTGSGKTEVYMHVCETAVKHGLSALVLVPEIALISQTEKRFRARFGDRVAVLHSGLTPGERYDQWLRIINEETPIVIGARSAVFAPLKKPGVIIVDEEHDTSYKQENNLRYHARDMAIVRAKQNGCTVLLGSATPSVQSYYNSTIQKSTVISLTRRVNRHPLPEIETVDLKKLRDADPTSRLLSPVLQKSIQETLDRKEQVILFLNRRGFANYPVCARCGELLRCKNCDVTLTLHKKANAYKCHFCGFSMAGSSGCGVCGSTHIKILGHGTEKIEQTVQALFPEATVDRLDQDTAANKSSLVKVLKGVKEKKTDILIGTQMIAKGHDFPGITLVGIICADTSLNFPDFRSGVRTFQLIAQVAGRAGRGSRPGRVILQTYAPEHFSIDAAKAQDFLLFYDQEIVFRKSLLFPPFSRLIQIRISAKERQQGDACARVVGECLKILQHGTPDYRDMVTIMGPIEAPIHKIANLYRWQVLLKSANTRVLHRLVRDFLNSAAYQKKEADIRISIDVDPFYMM